MINRTRIEALRKVRRVTLAALTTLWLGACGSDGGTTGPNGPNGPNGPSAPATPEGNFTLNMIDSKTLPFSMYADTGYTLEIMGGSIAITANGKWVSKITSRETVAGFASTYNDSTFGTWVVSGTTASFTNTETAVVSNVTWTASDVTVNEVSGSVTRKIVYKK
jgi:hypothetical protein